MERKIGEIFEYNGEWYQCVEGLYCDDCAFINYNCENRERITLREKLTKQPTTGFCNSEKRNDRKSVIFKKLEKVGEPKIINGKKVQLLKSKYCKNCDFWDNNDCTFTTYPRTCMGGEYGVYVEIKQNKEDMEEKKLNLKPFDIQKAREGKPVCTRDGRKARIICFDRKFYHDDGYNYPIVAMVNYNDNELVHAYTQDGLLIGNKESELDLMMLLEKKEGWVNVYKGIDGITFSKYPYPSKEEAIKSAGIMSNRIDTVKINWSE